MFIDFVTYLEIRVLICAENVRGSQDESSRESIAVKRDGFNYKFNYNT